MVEFRDKANGGVWQGLSLIKRVCQDCILHDLLKGSRWVLLTTMAVSTLSVEFVSAYIMTLISGIYYTISSGDTAGFYSLLIQALVIVSVLSLVVALKKLSIDACAIQWREDLVLRLHRVYFKRYVSFDMQHGVIQHSSIIDNPDQRIQQDCDKFTTSVSQAIATLVPMPGVLIYYTWHLWNVFGWIAPTSCYIYFGISTYVCAHFTKVLIPIVYNQDEKEGDFRFRHSRYRMCAEPITFLRGEAAEHRVMNDSFEAVCSNMRTLVIRRIPLHFWVTWFEYMGSIVNYAVVGFSILVVMRREDLSAAESAGLLSSGSYACLYLIGTFSTILTMSQEFSQVCGYSARVLEILDYTPRQSKESWLHYQDDDSSDNVIYQDGEQPSTLVSKWRAPILLWLGLGDFWGTSPGALESTSYDFLLADNEEDKLDTGSCTYMLVNNALSEMELKSFGTRVLDHQDRISKPLFALSIRNLYVYSSQQGGKCLIRNLTLDLPRGSRLIVTGASGQGKTTLFRVLAGLVPPSRPTRSCDPDTDGSSINYGCALKDVLFLPQESYFSEGSLEENVCYPHQQRSAHFRGILSEVGLSSVSEGAGQDFVVAKSIGTNAMSSFGAGFSPGELQRLSIARALYGKPYIVFLDEATSALDEDSEALLMSKVMSSCETIVSIGHRSSLLQYHNMRLHISCDGSCEFTKLP